MTLPSSHQQAYQNFLQSNYTQAAHAYEQLLKTQPQNRLWYWYWGLALLLQGQATEAQTTWFLGIMQEEDNIEAATTELRSVLITETQRFETEKKLNEVWQIRSAIQEITPDNFENLLHLHKTAISLKTFCSDDLKESGFLDCLQTQQSLPFEVEELLQFLEQVLKADPFNPFSLDLAEACLVYLNDLAEIQRYVNLAIASAMEIANAHKQPGIAAQITELCVQLVPNNSQILHYLAGFYQDSDQYDKGIAIAQRYHELTLTQSLPEQLAANSRLLRGLMTAGGYWTEAQNTFARQHLLLQELIETCPLEQLRVPQLLLFNFFAPYFHDEPRSTRKLQNQLGQLCQTKAQLEHHSRVTQYQQQQRNDSQRLRIGYLSNCFRSHSVGWLARWLIQYHDRDRFEVYGYFANCDPVIPDELHTWYVEQFDRVYKANKSLEIADRIAEDKIDILIDLDSVTSDNGAYVMMLKPAPIQVSWLGWDAAGIPAIDYFIADPYVLLDEAEEYYAEKIWRLPQTYIAVDGFEVGVPTLHRDELNIPEDAIVYFSAQRGYKRHPETTRLQMQILQQVPNSYFLIKGIGDETSIRAFFEELAEAEGVNRDRLRFLPISRSEAEHRANLSLADVVLDTYPYNGATTTLETLWVGVPLVTRVGKQFSARNSYTMLRNAGITEGIAETPEDYVNWGVRFGTDEALRASVAWKLHQSRHSAPLWNARQFTREMEKAYEQMWDDYCC
jgi:predicted O-linked N-acetylglucosamine transferase (SPINDLY family)